MTHPSDTPQIEHPAAEFQGADDLVKRLRADNNPDDHYPMIKRAADRIEQQAKRIEELEASRTPNPGKTHFADDDTLAYIAKLEAENQRLLNDCNALAQEVKTEQCLSFRDQVATLEAERHQHEQACIAACNELAAIKSVGMEPERGVSYYCNKCGYFGDTGPSHIRHDGELCDYLAVSDGPWYSAAQLSKLQAERNEAKSELLAMHEILMCPGECPPVAEGDTLTVRLLKGYVAAVDKVQAERDALKTSLKQAGSNGLLILAERDELSAQIARAREALEKDAACFRQAGLLNLAASVEKDLLTLSTGNAVQAIEARAYERAIAACEEVGPKEYPAKLVTEGFIAAIRKLAEQKEKGDAGVMEGK